MLTGNREIILDQLLQLAAIGVLMEDIAPRNVVISPEGNVKIIDFGRVLRSSLSKDRHEWLHYAAEELELPLPLVEAKVARLDWWLAAPSH
jgi:serine/threonine protein kinase